MREKILRTASQKFICIVDESKIYMNGEDITVPVEIVPFLYMSTVDHITPLCTSLEVRKDGEDTYTSDNGNFIVDATLPPYIDLKEWHKAVLDIPGVVETGIFLKPIDTIITGKSNGSTTTLEYAHE